MSLTREEYRKNRDKIDFYLNTVQEDNYEFLYKLIGPPVADCIILDNEDSKRVLELLRKYYQDKMNELA